MSQYWLVKQEPESYPWDQFVRDKKTAWEGVRNYQARNNLRAMKKGDLVFYYHSAQGKEVVGLARVIREHYRDPSARDGDWACVDLKPVKALKEPVSLARIKSEPRLKDLALVRHSRLSVMPVAEKEAKCLLELGRTNV